MQFSIRKMISLTSLHDGQQVSKGILLEKKSTPLVKEKINIKRRISKTSELSNQKRVKRNASVRPVINQKAEKKLIARKVLPKPAIKKRKMNIMMATSKNLYFAMVEDCNFKLKKVLKENNWKERSYYMNKKKNHGKQSKEMNSVDNLLLIKKSCPFIKFWTEINDATVVSSFPRQMDQYSVGLRKVLCVTDWVLNETVSPKTFIIRNFGDVLNFSNEFLKMACDNLLKYVNFHKNTIFNFDIQTFEKIHDEQSHHKILLKVTSKLQELRDANLRKSGHIHHFLENASTKTGR